MQYMCVECCCRTYKALETFKTSDKRRHALPVWLLC